MSIPGYNVRQLSTKNPIQMDIMSLLGQGSRSGTQTALSDYSGMLTNPDDYFKALEAPQQRQFQQNVGQIANRFSGLGMGAQDSSGFQAAVAGAGSQMAQNLGLQRLSLQENARKQLLALASELLGTNASQSFLMPKKKKTSWGSTALGIGLPVAGAAAGGFFGGPSGAMLGSKIGGLASSAFLE